MLLKSNAYFFLQEKQNAFISLYQWDLRVSAKKKLLQGGGTRFSKTWKIHVTTAKHILRVVSEHKIHAVAFLVTDIDLLSALVPSADVYREARDVGGAPFCPHVSLLQSSSRTDPSSSPYLSAWEQWPWEF